MMRNKRKAGDGPHSEKSSNHLWTACWQTGRKKPLLGLKYLQSNCCEVYFCFFSLQGIPTMLEHLLTYCLSVVQLLHIAKGNRWPRDGTLSKMTFQISKYSGQPRQDNLRIHSLSDEKWHLSPHGDFQLGNLKRYSWWQREGGRMGVSDGKCSLSKQWNGIRAEAQKQSGHMFSFTMISAKCIIQFQEHDESIGKGSSCSSCLQIGCCFCYWHKTLVLSVTSNALHVG